MEKYHLTAATRAVRGKQVRQLRNRGMVPAVLYGKGKESRMIELFETEFTKVFREAGYASLIDLVIDGKEQPVLVADVARDPLRETPLHVDFHLVDMSQKLRTRIPFQFVGESRAVKEFGGILVKVMDSIEIECLPDDLVPHVDVPLVQLVNISDMIRISDLGFPSSLRVLANADEVIVAVEKPRVEEPDKAAAPAPAEPVVVGKGEKKEKEDEAAATTTGPEKKQEKEKK